MFSDTVSAQLGKIVLNIVNLVASVTFSGYTLSVLWGWFIVPMFGLPALAIPAALGVMLIATYLTKGVPTKAEQEEVKWYYGWVKSLLALLIGAIYKAFM